jgi:hypothetical protein
MLDFSKWLPKDVVLHCQAKLDSGALSEEQTACILQLTIREDMHAVWQSLLKVTDDTDLLIDLIEYVRLHPAVMYTKTMPHKLTTANQRKVLTEVAALSERLLSTLSKLDPVRSDADQGIQLIQSEIHRLELLSSSYQLQCVGDLHQLYDALNAIDRDHGFVDVLETLKQAATLAMDAPPEGPRKQGAKTANRTAFIQDLKRYIQLHFDKQLNQAVATIVNTALNLAPETVTEDMVRKA